MHNNVLQQVRPVLRAVAETVVPESRYLDDDGWVSLEATVERALSRRGESVQKQLVLFLRAVDALPALRYGRRFRKLGYVRRAAVLRAFESSPLLVLRRGFWGLRTLIMMGYYYQPAIQDSIGYRAHREGWQKRRTIGESPPTSGEQAAIILNDPDLSTDDEGGMRDSLP
ncbi:MAG: gluconate 2-dehydrogenase subunit 3 family protein [Gemmatimonadota bacterium]